MAARNASSASFSNDGIAVGAHGVAIGPRAGLHLVDRHLERAAGRSLQPEHAAEVELDERLSGIGRESVRQGPQRDAACGGTLAVLQELQPAPRRRDEHEGVSREVLDVPRPDPLVLLFLPDVRVAWVLQHVDPAPYPRPPLREAAELVPEGVDGAVLVAGEDHPRFPVAAGGLLDLGGVGVGDDGEAVAPARPVEVGDEFVRDVGREEPHVRAVGHGEEHPVVPVVPAPLVVRVDDFEDEGRFGVRLDDRGQKLTLPLAQPVVHDGPSLRTADGPFGAEDVAELEHRPAHPPGVDGSGSRADGLAVIQIRGD